MRVNPSELAIQTKPSAGSDRLWRLKNSVLDWTTCRAEAPDGGWADSGDAHGPSRRTAVARGSSGALTAINYRHFSRLRDQKIRHRISRARLTPQPQTRHCVNCRSLDICLKRAARCHASARPPRHPTAGPHVGDLVQITARGFTRSATSGIACASQIRAALTG